MATMSSAQIISATAFHSKMALPGLPRPAYPAVSGVSGSVSWWVLKRHLSIWKDVGTCSGKSWELRQNGPKGICLCRINFMWLQQFCPILCSHWCKTIEFYYMYFLMIQGRKQSAPLDFHLFEMFLSICVTFLVQHLFGINLFGPSWPFLKFIFPNLILSTLIRWLLHKILNREGLSGQHPWVGSSEHLLSIDFCQDNSCGTFLGKMVLPREWAS